MAWPLFGAGGQEDGRLYAPRKFRLPAAPLLNTIMTRRPATFMHHPNLAGPPRVALYRYERANARAGDHVCGRLARRREQRCIYR